MCEKKGNRRKEKRQGVIKVNMGQGIMKKVKTGKGQCQRKKCSLGQNIELRKKTQNWKGKSKKYGREKQKGSKKKPWTGCKRNAWNGKLEYRDREKAKRKVGDKRKVMEGESTVAEERER